MACEFEPDAKPNTGPYIGVYNGNHRLHGCGSQWIIQDHLILVSWIGTIFASGRLIRGGCRVKALAQREFFGVSCWDDKDFRAWLLFLLAWLRT